MPTYWKDGSPAEPPFVAVVFVSIKSDELEGYAEADDFLMNAAEQQPGFLGYSSVGQANRGIFISYWKDQEAVAQWRKHSEHLRAKAKARDWYDYMLSLVCEVKSSMEWNRQLKEWNSAG